MSATTQLALCEKALETGLNTALDSFHSNQVPVTLRIMTTYSPSFPAGAPPRPAQATRLRRAALCYAVAGLGFLCFGFPFWFLHAVDEPASGSHQLLPFVLLRDELLPATSAFWLPLLSSLGLLGGGYSLWQAGAPLGFGPGRRRLLVPLAGAVCYFLSAWMVLPFAPLGALLNGVGMVLVGVASLKVRIWTGWARFAPLLAGSFPFLFMYPLLLLTGHRPAAVIGLWGIPWVLLGLAAWQRSKAVAG